MANKLNWQKQAERIRLSREIGLDQPVRPRKGISANAPLCPKCGCYMVVRRSPHGTFWGCGQFPRCKGIRSVDG
jgi:hypothetical protein